MTAPTGDLHAALADMLAAAWEQWDDEGTEPEGEAWAAASAAALLPVVESYGRACAATALHDAADDLTTGDPALTAPVKRYLRARADALREADR